MDIKDIKFDDKGLVPAIAQSMRTGEVLMLAYMNEESIEKTLSSGLVHYYSRSREKLWQKGETSGNVQRLRSFRYDCDMDTLLVMVDQEGVACHTGERNCFYRKFEGATESEGAPPGVLGELFDVLLSRKGADPKSSYVAGLYEKGTKAITDKVAEESGELIEAAMGGKKKEIVHETADLWFHTLVLLADAGVDVTELFTELKRRFGTSGLTEKRSREKKG
jgi:phosphoribosyl-ATP pyrophosphohydrolase/phosphoribosyl-AMP cyclohydrolase